jgi:hypothetical protein
MEMTETRHDVPGMLDGARLGRAAVLAVLSGEPVPLLDGEHAMTAANFLGYVMFTVQIANGLHPRASTDFLPGQDRGSALGRAFLASGTVEVCCDYCGQLMTEALAGAAATQMRAMHGPQAGEQWAALAYALTGPPL